MTDYTDCPDELDVLTETLQDEHAAIYAYGVLGAHLGVAVRRTALGDYDAHRAIRDQLRGRLLAAGRQAPTTQASYDVVVSSPSDAVALAVRLEEGLAVRWRDLVATATDRGLRAFAVRQLQDCAVRAALWRNGSVPLPGTT